jgi:histidine triad (HIT) family protein
MTTDPSCIFCKIVKGELPSHKVYEDEHYYAFLDIHPISPGHTLIVPRNHAPDMLHSTPTDRKGLLEIVHRIAPSILKAVNAKAFNVGINVGADAGQIVFHTHVHLIPRKSMDGLSDWKNISQTHEELSQIAERVRGNQ